MLRAGIHGLVTASDMAFKKAPVHGSGRAPPRAAHARRRSTRTGGSWRAGKEGRAWIVREEEMTRPPAKMVSGAPRVASEIARIEK